MTPREKTGPAVGPDPFGERPRPPTHVSAQCHRSLHPPPCPPTLSLPTFFFPESVRWKAECGRHSPGILPSFVTRPPPARAEAPRCVCSPCVYLQTMGRETCERTAVCCCVLPVLLVTTANDWTIQTNCFCEAKYFICCKCFPAKNSELVYFGVI